jgi:iron complex transport system substrate-binding protein
VTTIPTAGGESALGVVDDSGRQVRLEAPAQRIVTLAPHGAELVFAAGAGAKLVGATFFSNYPPAAAQVPRIGDAARLDRERLLALEPDLVIAWSSGNRSQDLAWLEKRGIALYRSDPAELQDIAENIREIGGLAGSGDIAAAAAARFAERLAELRQKYSRQTPLRVFYQIWPSPLFTVGNGHIISQVLALCGGRTLFSDLTTPTPTVSREAVILANPQAIVAAITEQGGDDPFTQWRRWRSIEAVRAERFIRVPADLIHRPTPRILDGAELICRGLHAEP